MTLDEHLAELWAEVGEMKRRQANVLRHGRVTDIDTKKQLVRLRLNPDTDDTEFKSAWIPYGQQAGDFKFHNPPTKGQNMTVISPSGELGQAVALPFTWNETFASPGDSEDEHVITFGKVTITYKKDSLILKVGDNTSITLTESGIEAKSQKITLNGSSRVETIGNTYLGLTDKDQEGPKVETEGGPALKTYAKV